MRISDCSSDVCSSDLLQKMKAADNALVLAAHDINDSRGLALSALISQCWDLDGVARQYRGFSGMFGPILAAVDERLQPEQAFIIRALAIHEWRRRSEEHTSELQSLMRISYAVFCLKKKTTKAHHKT